jgi:hypothetical protein
MNVNWDSGFSGVFTVLCQSNGFSQPAIPKRWASVPDWWRGESTEMIKKEQKPHNHVGRMHWILLAENKKKQETANDLGTYCLLFEDL